MTSNIGADLIKRQSSFGFKLARDEKTEEKQSYDEMRKKLLDSLKRVFRPEFINRLDGVIVFRMLGKEDIRSIASLEIMKVSDRLKEHNITLHASEAVINLVAEEGFDPDMGARPLRRVIMQKIEDKLSDALLAKEFEDNTKILIELDEDNQIIFRKEEAETAPEVEEALV